MNETFEDYCNRRSWSGYIEPLREMWDDWQRDRGFLIENIDEAEKQRDELLAALHEIAGHPGHILSGSMETEAVKYIWILASCASWRRLALKRQTG